MARRGKDEPVPGFKPTEVHSKDIQDALVEEYRLTGNLELRDNIIQSQLGWIKKLARNFASASKADDFKEDLLQEGVIALLHSLESYDPKKGRLTTYVTQPLNTTMRRHLFVFLEQVHPPHRFYDKKKQIEKARKEIEQEKGEQATRCELLAVLSVSEEELLEVERAFKSNLTKSLQVTNQRDLKLSRSWYDGLKQMRTLPEAFENVLEEEYKVIFADYFRQRILDAKSLAIVLDYVGLVDEDQPKYQHFLAEKYNVSQTRVFIVLRNNKAVIEGFRAYALEVMGIKG